MQAAALVKNIRQSVDTLANIVGNRRRRQRPVKEVDEELDEESTPVKSVVNIVRPPPTKKAQAGDLWQRLGPSEPSTSSSVAAASSLFSIPDARNRLNRRLGHIPAYQQQRQFRQDAAIEASILPSVGDILPAPLISIPASPPHASGPLAPSARKGKPSLE